MPRCSVCRNEGHNRRKCPSKVVAPEPPLEPLPQPQPEPQIQTLSKKFWICAYCDLPLGNDHRPCICYGFEYSVDAWQKAAIERGQQLLDGGRHPMGTL
jgi:hypothetical protein